MVKTWTYKDLDEKYGKLCKRYNSVCYDKQRLKAQLDREIHINQKMKSALEKYAFENTKMKVLVNDRFKEVEVPYANDTSLALQVLKEIDNKE